MPLINSGRLPHGPKRLAHYLILKSVVELALVGALAVSFHLNAFNPHLRGWVDEASSQWVRGWVVDQNEPAAHIEVQLYINNQFAESRPADHARPDLVAEGAALDEDHGFFFFTPPLGKGEHEARVYAAHESGEGKRRTLRLIGKPLKFTVDANPSAPYFRGWLELASPQIVKGWTVSRDASQTLVEVHLYIDNRFVESRLADQPRPELKAGEIIEDEKHGFLFFTPTLTRGEHEVRVYVVHNSSNSVAEPGRVLRLIGRPIQITVE